MVDEFGYRAPLHPRPFPKPAGTGAHVHISVSSLGLSAPPEIGPFFAGIINHLPSRIAFCLPLNVPYERVATELWSGGEFASWGWYNKEIALPRINSPVDDKELQKILGEKNTTTYIEMTKEWDKQLDGMDEQAKRMTLLPNYYLGGGHEEKTPRRCSLRNYLYDTWFSTLY
ncbi:FluG family protein [Penicillium mononematosum]|uniref:FluG family protein n=1 Tax=Penicillium mononematosum TaxID=268346 RepID=UPI0025491600|nr:FluG family protein [Penicillium mononematosum]KAJ6191552.1 FluG family protein [Penicillium mononematosum]